MVGRVCGSQFPFPSHWEQGSNTSQALAIPSTGKEPAAQGEQAQQVHAGRVAGATLAL